MSIVLMLYCYFIYRYEPQPMKEEKGVLGLTAIRRNRGISLEQIADSTKISIRLLQAIEQGDFRRLPGGIYNTSYIRQYAKAIDYDEAALLAFYHGEMARVDDAATSGVNSNGMYGGMRSPSTLLGS
jgi:cytoskeletal protein RodZ